MDPNSKELSLYEKKSLLINKELNAMGMGKYQWYIWSLCGLGYFLDLLWAQAFGLIATPLQQELGFSSECFQFSMMSILKRMQKLTCDCRW
ncbi:MAG: hypothetical protein CL912_12835 [Deltaproteobacteria bacterium]|nr:hypothetical protein [Deltaproteobacteria bacterium]